VSVRLLGAGNPRSPDSCDRTWLSAGARAPASKTNNAAFFSPLGGAPARQQQLAVTETSVGRYPRLHIARAMSLSVLSLQLLELDIIDHFSKTCIRLLFPKLCLSTAWSCETLTWHVVNKKLCTSMFLYNVACGQARSLTHAALRRCGRRGLSEGQHHALQKQYMFRGSVTVEYSSHLPA